MEVHNYVVGEEITLKLMKRERSSTFSLPKDQWAPREQPLNLDGKILSKDHSLKAPKRCLLKCC